VLEEHRLRRARAAGDRTDTRREFLKVERLREIIVGSGIERETLSSIVSRAVNIMIMA
jgi:hypothetical protein